MSISTFLKGWAGEAMGAAAQWAFLDSSIYTAFNNLTLASPKGTTQIDHVIVSKFGIFVVEAKNVDGWIFGDEQSSHWTIVRHSRKFKMQNPLRQNYRHVRAISEFLAIREDQIHSLVMFWGECVFKTKMPRNVIMTGYANYIKSFQTVLFHDSEVSSITENLKIGMLPKTWATRSLHVKSLNARYGSTTVCPKCSSELMLRTAKTGVNAGAKFLGCSNYPKCRYTAPCTSEA